MCMMKYKQFSFVYLFDKELVAGKSHMLPTNTTSCKLLLSIHAI